MHKMATCSALLLVLQLIAAASAATQRLHISSHGSIHASHSQTRSVPGCDRGAVVYGPPVYHPSKWEAAWTAAMAKGDEAACAFIKSSKQEVVTWLDTIKERDNIEYSMASAFRVDLPRRHEVATDGLSDEVFSKFVFTNTCPGELAGLTKELHVEPLVGHLRHPRSLEPCRNDKDAAVHIMELSFQLINPWPAADFHLAYPGKKYLLDCGTSDFGTSLQYLTTRYRQAGIEFDEIWAWEVQKTDPTGYWNAVPSVFKPRLHFYNTAITSDFADAGHPLNIIRSIYRPGDFIAFKLDVDNNPLETAIMAEIDSDSETLAMIGEMFYEQHYDHAEMAANFGLHNSAKLSDVVSSFGRLRAKGLLLHYWP